MSGKKKDFGVLCGRQRRSISLSALRLRGIALVYLLTSVAHAEVVGAVDFVTGAVVAATPDGKARLLRKGDEIAVGDRITTHHGRIQIRFHDEGRVSLQPDTIFGVDQYLYYQEAANESSLQFRLIQGGMRSMPGAIGHERGSVYRLSTPSGFLRVKADSYLARFDDDTLQVASDTGKLILDNDRGSLSLLSGQAGYMSRNSRPMPSDDQSPDIWSATPLEAEVLVTETPYTAVASAQLGSNGLPLGLNAPPVTPPTPSLLLSSTVNGAPLYNLAIPGMQSTSTSLAGAGGYFSNLQAHFDTQSGALLSANSVIATMFDNAASSGALQYRNVTNETVISFGELYSGASTTGGVVAGKDQYIPYIVGIAGAAPALSGSVSYHLAAATDATAARQYNKETGLSSSGTVKQFNITLDLTRLQLGVDLQVQMNSSSTASGSSTSTAAGFEVKASNLSVPDLQQRGGFALHNLSVTGMGGGSCTGCSAEIDGFFAGTDGARLGASYDIGTADGDILGVAALTQNGAVGISNTAALLSSTSPVFSFATPTGGFPVLSGDSSNYSYSGLQATLSSTNQAAGSLLTLSSNGQSSGVIFDNTGGTPWQYSGLTTLGNLSFAELTKGTGTLNLTGVGGVVGSQSLDGNTYLPYIVGLTGSLPDQNLGTVHYVLEGGTAPRLNQQQAGTLNHFSIDLDLSRLLMSIDLLLSMNGSSYSVKGSNLSVASLSQGPNFMLRGLGVSGGACPPSGGCAANVGGFLAGSGATQLGVAYALNLGSNTGVISGVAALEQESVAVAYTSGFGAPNSKVQSGVGVVGDNTGMLSANVGSNSLLQRVTAIAAADVGTDGVLEWGRWISGNPLVEGNATTQTLTDTDSLHYVIGQQTPSAILNALATQPGMITYTLEGHGTAPTNGTTAGVLNSGQLQVNFAAGTVGVNLSVGMGTQSYSINDAGRLTTGSAVFSLANLSTTGTGGACAKSCSTNASGFFAGSNANKVGLTYAISDTGQGTVRGAAGFGR